MPLTKNDLRRFASAVRATDFSTPDVGGARSATELFGGSVGETLFTMPSPEWGSGTPDRTQYGKEFIRNVHPTDTLASAKIWMQNALDPWPGGNSTVWITSSSEADDSTRKVRLIGLDVNEEPVTLEVGLNGTTTVPSLDLMTYLARATLHDVGTDELVPAAGTIFINHGESNTLMGIIPPERYSATAEIDFALAGTLDDTLTIATADVAPSGVTFGRQATRETGQSVANGGSLTAGAAQGIWLRLRTREGIHPSVDFEYVFGIAGSAVGI